MKPWFSLFLRRMLQMHRDFLTTCTQKSTRGAKLQADTVLCAKNERPQNRTDAKPCLSDVYKMSTRAKTRQADTIYYRRSAENGADKVLSRGEENSSVHMTYVNFPKPRKSALDVPLYASSSGRIIGVLSVGAISGYSKAMEKYRWNKFVNSVNLLVAQATQFIANNKASDTESLNLTAMLHKINAFPEGFNLSVINFRYTPNIGFQYGYIYQYSSEHHVLEIYFESPTSDFCKKTLTTPWEGLAWDYQGGGLRVYSSAQKQYIKFTKPLNINDANRACDPWTEARSRISFYYRY